MAFDIKYIAPDGIKKQSEAPDNRLRRVLRLPRRGEAQFRSIAEIVVRLKLSILHGADFVGVRGQMDAIDEILARYLRRDRICERRAQRDMQDMIVVLRLSLMRTLWEARGILDLPYIDSVIRQTISNFKNKHQIKIKKEHWGILADMCWQDVNHARRYEQVEETDPVDADIDMDDIDAWINSEL